MQSPQKVSHDRKSLTIKKSCDPLKKLCNNGRINSSRLPSKAKQNDFRDQKHKTSPNYAFKHLYSTGLEKRLKHKEINKSKV